MDDTATEGEQRLARVAVAAVLLDGVFDRLLGQAVLLLKRRNRQTVDEQAQVQRAPRLIAAVRKLPSYAESIAGVQLRAVALPGDGVP